MAVKAVLCRVRQAIGQLMGQDWNDFLPGAVSAGTWRIGGRGLQKIEGMSISIAEPILSGELGVYSARAGKR